METEAYARAASPGANSPPPARRGQALLAWAVIVVLIGLVLFRNAARYAANEEAEADSFNGTARLAMQLQSRYLYGVMELGFPVETLLDQGREALGDTPSSAMAYAILLAAITEQERVGLALLEELESSEQSLSADEQHACELLSRWYEGEQLDEGERSWLKEKFGWVGRLALAYGEDEALAVLAAEAKRLALALLIGSAVALLLLMVGLVLWTFALIAPFQGWVRFVPPPDTHVGIYAEKFALYMALYFGGSFALSFWPAAAKNLGVNGLLILSCLVVLVWPVLRGVPWARVQEEMGLRFRWADLPLGIATELAALPCILLGALTMLGTMRLLRSWGYDPGMPSHPLGEMVADLGWWGAVQMVFVAAICAPVVEEIFFRGALYTHLSQTARGWSTLGRVGFAVLVSSFVFAVVHPQGWLGTLLLTPLAAVFALVREARGSVYPSMVAHMIHNGTICLVVLTLLR